jgi:hypothetical protein
LGVAPSELRFINMKHLPKVSRFLDAGGRVNHTQVGHIFTIEALESGLLEGDSSKTIARLTLRALSSLP